jgi:hypothetical protein
MIFGIYKRNQTKLFDTSSFLMDCAHCNFPSCAISFFTIRDFKGALTPVSNPKKRGFLHSEKMGLC